MKKVTLSGLLISLLVVFTISACGGGGGVSTTTVQPTTAVITLASAVTGSIPAGTIITSYDITVTLPTGVTVTSANPPQVDDGVLTVIGGAAGASAAGVYTAATGTVPGKLRILIGSGTGMSAGEFGTVNCDIAAGYYPVASNFPPPTFAVGGFDTNTDSTVDLTGQMALTAGIVIK